MIIPPQSFINYVKEAGVFSYPQLQVKPVSSEVGDGVFARVAIEPNSVLVYYGVELIKELYEQLKAQSYLEPDKRLTDYIVASGRIGVHIDGSPRHQPHNAVGGHGRYIAAKVNEPMVGSTANTILTSIVMEGKKMPAMITIRRIEAGEQLTTSYGGEYTRIHFKDGQFVKYVVGKRARKPDWWNRKSSVHV